MDLYDKVVFDLMVKLPDLKTLSCLGFLFVFFLRQKFYPDNISVQHEMSINLLIKLHFQGVGMISIIIRQKNIMFKGNFILL